jgi:hypothetical protein
VAKRKTCSLEIARGTKYMHTKKAVVTTASTKLLRQIASLYELTVTDRRSREALQNAVLSSRKCKIDNLLANLTEQEVKAVCNVVGVDSRGRKNLLITRLLEKKPIARNAPDHRQLVTVKANKSRWSQIQKGMSFNEVEKIFGSDIWRTSWSGKNGWLVDNESDKNPGHGYIIEFDENNLVKSMGTFSCD